MAFHADFSKIRTFRLVADPAIRRASFITVGTADVIAATARFVPSLIRSAANAGVAMASEVATLEVAYWPVIGATLEGGISPSKRHGMLVEMAALFGTTLIHPWLRVGRSKAWALARTGIAFELARAATDFPGG